MQNNATFTVHQSTRLEENQAADIARQLVEINQNYNALNSGRFDHKERQAKLGSLLQSLTQVMEDDLPHASALSLAGRISTDLGHTDLATAYHINAISLEPNNTQSNLNYAYHLFETGQYLQAQEKFKHVLSLDKKNLQAFKGIAATHLKLGHFDLALIHYQALLSYGVIDPTVHEHLFQCVENLQCESYVESTENLILYLYTLDGFDPARLNRFAAQVLTHKFGLQSPDSAIDLDLLVADKLFLNILESGLVTDTAFETLIVEVRKSIFIESMLSLSLRDELIPCAIAIGVYVNHADYGLSASEEEDAEISALKHVLASNIGPHSDIISDSSGALILLGMYEALYNQSFAVSLLKYDLEEWPDAIQSLVRHALYDLAQEHDTHRLLFGESMSELLDNSVSRASQRWKAYSAKIKTSFAKYLAAHYNEKTLTARDGDKAFRILVLGCGSGEKAYKYASRFHDVEVVGLDNNKRNLCYAFNETRHLQISNLEYCFSDYRNAPRSQLELFDFIEVNENFDFEQLENWLPLLAPRGLLKLNVRGIRQQEQLGIVNDLLKARRLQPSLENIRMLRHSILLEDDSNLWGSLTRNLGFYSSAGCRDILFNGNLAFFDFERCQNLVNQAGFKIVEPANLNLKEALDTDELVSFIANKI
jgi:SAM-dependent methyltransferase/Tfp pilus assembly protein PilF